MFNQIYNQSQVWLLPDVTENIYFKSDACGWYWHSASFSENMGKETFFLTFSCMYFSLNPLNYFRIQTTDWLWFRYMTEEMKARQIAWESHSYWRKDTSPIKEIKKVQQVACL